ncbi:MAG: sigma-70 family RNA polymerase sigma factor [Oscillospiraceae bacterium]|nr:sigma-70 family RNA polymerase sigma factor [Oscillospiraceae bacterium]MDE6004282.1 sigma-70 family RNA polymerase sigma factor [Oscillospiraceae bacterium]
MDNGASSYRRFLNGDDSGMIELIRDYKNGLVLYLNSLTNNLEDAEDLMEDTFFKLAVKKPRFYGRSSFKTWLYAIGHNLAMDYLRKNSRSSDMLVSTYDVIASNEDIEQNYIKEEQKIMLYKALSHITPEYRQVICLIYFEEFDIAQTAKIMRKTKRQISNMLYQAKQSLRRELEKEGYHHAGL